MGVDRMIRVRYSETEIGEHLTLKHELAREACGCRIEDPSSLSDGDLQAGTLGRPAPTWSGVRGVAILPETRAVHDLARKPADRARILKRHRASRTVHAAFGGMRCSRAR